MASRDPRVDAYIQKSADFAKPILAHLRDTVHSAAPSTDETIKWGMPFFMYEGRILCSMASFKAHCAFLFWKGSQVVEQSAGRRDEAMGQFGRITKVSDLPSKKELTGYIRKAIALHEEIAKSPPVPEPKAKKPPIPMPAPFKAALTKSKKASAAFEKLSPSHRRDYLEWITEAKTDATRDKRIATSVEWIAEGKSRMWKYEKP
ncbi:MAG: YdeI/OmpD-associated family protein [Gemmatimonadaceae bacterium]